MFDKVLDLNKCHLQKDPSNKIRLSVKKFAEEHNLTFFDLKEQKGLLRNLLIRTASTNDLMVLVQFYEKIIKISINLVLEHIKAPFLALPHYYILLIKKQIILYMINRLYATMENTI